MKKPNKNIDEDMKELSELSEGIIKDFNRNNEFKDHIFKQISLSYILLSNAAANVIEEGVSEKDLSDLVNSIHEITRCWLKDNWQDRDVRIVDGELVQ